MTEFAKEVIAVNLEDEMKQSYLDYAMSVIVGRALPDVRDGLKPVHRRVLYAMSELGNDWNKAYKKSARVVGDVIGKYHPHGDTAVYDTIVRMAQPFSLRYMLVDGQGNFGSVDGDAPAAMRYTEVRMARIAHELLADIDKETVPFVPNYDETEREPSVFPTRIPNLLINGSSGIAVGMATNIPPHNFTEVVNACLALVDHPELTIDELMQYIPGPDLPTAGIINGVSGIREAYHTGRGRMFIRARCHIETDEKSGKDSIIVTELPYQVNKARLLERIAELVKEKKVEGITELRDESDKDGMRMVIELRRGESTDVVLNNLYQQTQLQSVFGINMVALVDGQPRTLNLKEMIDAFIRHRREVVTRRTIFELRKARESAHVMEGLAVALANIDEMIEMIKTSSGPADAKAALLSRDWESGLVQELLARSGAEQSRPQWLPKDFGLHSGRYRLSEVQAQAILDLRLQRLTGLEQDKIRDDYKKLLGEIAELLEILGSYTRMMDVIREELTAVRDQYGDARRTEIIESHLDLNPEDLIPQEDVVVTFSHSGYAKSQQLKEYRAQKRGGKGKAAATVKEEDFIDKLFVANTHDTLLCFSSRGKVYWLKVYQIPLASRASRGRPIVNLLPLEADERISTVLPVKEFDENHYVFMATAAGVVKKTPLSDFSRPRTSGIIAVDLRPDDYLINAGITDGTRHVLMITDVGKAIRFDEQDVRPMGRTATGVRGVTLKDDQRVIRCLILDEQGAILTVTENGYGKRTAVDEFPAHGRGGQGVIAIQTSERNGNVVGAVQVLEDQQIMLISNGGTLVRTRVGEISLLGRNTQGVKLISLTEGEKLVGVDSIVSMGEEDGEEGDEDITDVDNSDNTPGDEDA
jgi:DNA gyrase subunit A